MGCNAGNPSCLDVAKLPACITCWLICLPREVISSSLQHLKHRNRAVNRVFCAGPAHGPAMASHARSYVINCDHQPDILLHML